MSKVRYRLRIGNRELALNDGETRIGRGKDCDITLDDEMLSSAHAVIRADGPHVFVTDLGSSNGTQVNGQMIDKRRRLQPGDVLRLGKIDIALQVASRDGTSKSHPTLAGKATLMDVETGAPDSDPLQRAFDAGSLADAEKLLKARVVGLLRAPPPHPARHPGFNAVVDGMLTLAEKQVDGVWLHRLFKLYLAGGWWMADSVQKRVERLVRAVGRVNGDGMVAYIDHWDSQRSGLPDAEVAQLRRLVSLTDRDIASW